MRHSSTRFLREEEMSARVRGDVDSSIILLLANQSEFDHWWCYTPREQENVTSFPLVEYPGIQRQLTQPPKGHLIPFTDRKSIAYHDIERSSHHFTSGHTNKKVSVCFVSMAKRIKAQHFAKKNLPGSFLMFPKCSREQQGSC